MLSSPWLPPILGAIVSAQASSPFPSLGGGTQHPACIFCAKHYCTVLPAAQHCLKIP
jgi:hypothetical protein